MFDISIYYLQKYNVAKSLRMAKLDQLVSSGGFFDIILYIDMKYTCFDDAFEFEMAMRYLPLDWQTKVLKKKSAKDRQRMLCNRLLQLYACSLVSGIPFQQLKFEYGKFGKPRLSGTNNISFSMSNGEDFVLIYIIHSKNNAPEVGLDIASRDDLTDSSEIHLFEGIFTEVEYACLKECPDQDKKPMFAYYWSLKESFTKLMGTGLNYNLKDIDIGKVKDLYHPKIERCRSNNGKEIYFQSMWLTPEMQDIVSICHEEHQSFPIDRKVNIVQVTLADIKSSLD